MRLSCTIGELFVEIHQHRPVPLAFGALVGGDSVPISKRFFGTRKLYRVPGLLWAVVCVVLHLVILVEHRLVTDTHRHTNEQTDG